jgi:histidine phosphotransferase ChpT
MMPQDEATLELVIDSRICHDLASPLGAVANGLELLTLSGMGDSAELALVQDSLRGAKAVLDISRIAYGHPASGEQMGADALQTLATAYYAGKPRLTLDWQLSGTQSRARAQIILLACLAAEQAVPRGGTLAVEGDIETVRITARGTTPTPDLDLWDAIAAKTPLPEPDPRQAHFHMLRRCLAAQELSLTTRLDPDAFVIEI